MTTFVVKDGQLTLTDGSTASAYSGSSQAWDDPTREAEKGVGPIPAGTWAIGAPHDSPHTGPFSLPLEPVAGTETFGRSGFLIHGDSAAEDHTASHGCLVCSRGARMAIDEDPDRTLVVI
jgi:hypothetical protein